MTAQLALDLDAPPVRVAAWNSRWLRFCAAHGERPELRECEPRAGRFMAWIGAHWREYRADHGIDREAPLMPEDHAAFDARLAERYPYPWLVEETTACAS